MNEFQQLEQALNELFDEIVRVLRLREICDWLETKLNGRGNDGSNQ